VRTLDKVNGLLDLGAGMHPDLTGRENAICSGVLAGLSRREITAKMDDVIEFAELEEFIDEPLRGYSAGMKLRLGFAVAAQTRPTILLIDEVLAVGDMAFQRKCLQRIEEFRTDGCAIVLISHDLNQVEANCDRTLWLDAGSVMALGATPSIARHYEAEMMQRYEGTPNPLGTIEPGAPLDELENRITQVRMLGRDGQEIDTLTAGDPLTIQVWAETVLPMEQMRYSMTLANDSGTDLIDVTTEVGQLPHRPGKVMIQLEIDRLDLSAGAYNISMGLYNKDWTMAYDRRINAYQLTVVGRESWCSVSPPHRWTIS